MTELGCGWVSVGVVFGLTIAAGDAAPVGEGREDGSAAVQVSATPTRTIENRLAGCIGNTLRTSRHQDAAVGSDLSVIVRAVIPRIGLERNANRLLLRPRRA
jgi:hypothetical protein